MDKYLIYKDYYILILYLTEISIVCPKRSTLLRKGEVIFCWACLCVNEK